MNGGEWMFACFSNECKQTLSKFAIKGAFISRYITIYEQVHPCE